ncbi:Lrp/AsnC family transcriptional regulator [Salmonella enterica subsp. enterica serovar Telelkebir]|nr:Lrp/AsnC family transcriptional regulator [Salmonella enterica subsp. enterica serovar Telelkebir]
MEFDFTNNIYIPRGFFREHNLKSNTGMLYLTMHQMQEAENLELAKYSVADFASKIGCSSQATKRYIKKLLASGYIERVKASTPKTPAVYKVVKTFPYTVGGAE